MEKEVFLLLVYALSLSLVSAQEVRVGVVEVIDGRITAVSYDSNVEGVFKVTLEFFNVGSVGYGSRARLDVYNGTRLLFTGWSQEKSLNPGERKIFTIYWYPRLKGEFTGRIRVYYGNEIKNFDGMKILVKDVTLPKQAVEIMKVNTFEDEIEILVRSNETLSDVILIPSNYPLGWMFEQKRLEKLEKDRIKKVTIEYEPSLWMPRSVTLNFVTEDGSYFTSKSVQLKKESGFMEIFHRFLNTLRVLLNV